MKELRINQISSVLYNDIKEKLIEAGFDFSKDIIRVDDFKTNEIVYKQKD